MADTPPSDPPPQDGPEPTHPTPPDDADRSDAEPPAPPYTGTPWPPPAGGPPPPAPGGYPVAPEPAAGAAQGYPAQGYPGQGYAGQGHPAPPQKGGGSIWLGIGISLAAIALLVVASATTSGADAFSVIALLWLALPALLLIAGIVLAVIPRTRRTGGGLLIGMGAAVLIGGGVCIALIAVSSVGY